MKDEYKDNIIVNLTLEFALKIIDFCDDLDNLKKYSLSKNYSDQVLQLVLIPEKHKMLKVLPTLFTSLK